MIISIVETTACNGFFITNVNSCFSHRSTSSPSKPFHSKIHTKLGTKYSRCSNVNPYLISHNWIPEAFHVSSFLVSNTLNHKIRRSISYPRSSSYLYTLRITFTSSSLILYSYPEPRNPLFLQVSPFFLISLCTPYNIYKLISHLVFLLETAKLVIPSGILILPYISTHYV